MTRFIALLRGINVGAQKIIKMEKLRKSMASAGFKNVQTYVQSGNLVFETAAQAPPAIAAKIQKVIKKDFGFDVPTVVLTPSDLAKIVKSSPFAQKKRFEGAFLYVAFLAGAPASGAAAVVEELQSENEKFVLKGQAIHLCYFKGYGRAKITNNHFEKKLSVVSTCRNWNTCNELLRMTKEE